MQRPNASTHTSVWALPLSLATTCGIVFTFSSYGYLDVSVPRVGLLDLWIQSKMYEHYSIRVAPFGNLRINGCFLLRVAYRR